MRIKVLAFGQIAEAIGSSGLETEAPDTDTLKKVLETQYPALKALKYAVAVDKEMINGNVALTGQSVVALMPPFSGG